MPLLAIGREYAIAQKVVPVLVEVLALAIVVELGRQNRFDILRVCSENNASWAVTCFNGPWIGRVAICPEVPQPELEDLVLRARCQRIIKKVEGIRSPALSSRASPTELFDSAFFDRSPGEAVQKPPNAENEANVEVGQVTKDLVEHLGGVSKLEISLNTL